MRMRDITTTTITTAATITPVGAGGLVAGGFVTSVVTAGGTVALSDTVGTKHIFYDKKVT